MLGVDCVPSMANFLFFKTAYNAETVNQSLLRQGVILKPWREPGYTDYLRVSVGSHQDNDLFLAALANSLASLAEHSLDDQQTRSA